MSHKKHERLARETFDASGAFPLWTDELMGGLINTELITCCATQRRSAKPLELKVGV